MYVRCQIIGIIIGNLKMDIFLAKKKMFKFQINFVINSIILGERAYTANSFLKANIVKI